MANDVVIEAWNTVLFEKFSRFKFIFLEGCADSSAEVMQRDPHVEGAHVLKVGCGCLGG